MMGPSLEESTTIPSGPGGARTLYTVFSGDDKNELKNLGFCELLGFGSNTSSVAGLGDDGRVPRVEGVSAPVLSYNSAKEFRGFCSSCTGCNMQPL